MIEIRLDTAVPNWHVDLLYLFKTNIEFNYLNLEKPALELEGQRDYACIEEKLICKNPKILALLKTSDYELFLYQLSIFIRNSSISSPAITFDADGRIINLLVFMSHDGWEKDVHDIQLCTWFKPWRVHFVFMHNVYFENV
jgi:hypothetical protein